MRYQFPPSFRRTFARLDPPRMRRVQEAVNRLIRAFDTGQLPHGLGLKPLRKDLWELRAGLSDRVLFYRTGDLVEFLLAGNHEEVRRFLKTL